MTQLRAEIVAIEYALPERVETNPDLHREFPQWDVTGLAKRTGVFERHIAAVGECASDLAQAACEKLFQDDSISRDEVDALILCTQSPDFIMPHTSALLQHRLGLSKRVAAFDYTLACSGYVYGLAMSRAFIESGIFNSILLVTCDTYSKYIRPDDRATRTLFGDGAAATLIRAGTSGIGEVELATDGSGAERFIVRTGGLRTPAIPGQGKPAIEMDGLGVLSFVNKEIPAFTERLLTKAGLERDSVDLFVFHQASKVSLDQVASILRIPSEKTLINFSHIGNTVSSSIPIAIRDAWTAGRLRPGMLTVLVGFGVGFSWAGAVVQWSDQFRIPQA